MTHLIDDDNLVTFKKRSMTLIFNIGFTKLVSLIAILY